MELTRKEVELLHKIVEGYLNSAHKRLKEATDYYQDDLFDSIKLELGNACALISKICDQIEEV